MESERVHGNSAHLTPIKTDDHWNTTNIERSEDKEDESAKNRSASDPKADNNDTMLPLGSNANISKSVKGSSASPVGISCWEDWLAVNDEASQEGERAKDSDYQMGVEISEDEKRKYVLGLLHGSEEMALGDFVCIQMKDKKIALGNWKKQNIFFCFYFLSFPLYIYRDKATGKNQFEATIFVRLETTKNKSLQRNKRELLQLALEPRVFDVSRISRPVDIWFPPKNMDLKVIEERTRGRDCYFVRYIQDPRTSQIRDVPENSEPKEPKTTSSVGRRRIILFISPDKNKQETKKN
ncbi:hypothetical protein RFI_20992 [Reticulomyxa filosa]|uniref:BAH domain-containing protein n=1 Tax=Reticulomyxa filosa TaxID=46433 RepID=X6MQT7_RETFI|nr:hypothetical protein RFI_20992 [Reticulomyxa filosa]|eukprot:ETO16358.1 hypothetical protein RFI_20992 [Reticulomyxa filosa]